MKKMDGWKKISISVLAVMILLRIGYIMAGDIDREYYVSADIDLTAARAIPCIDVKQTFQSEKSRLNSIELVFDQLQDDRVGEVTLKIVQADDLIYQTNISLNNMNNLEWKKVYVNAPLTQDKEYTICLSASEECTQIPVLLAVKEEKKTPEAVNSVFNGQETGEQVAIRYGYLKFPGRLDRMISSSLWIIFFAVCTVVIIYLEDIMKKSKELCKYRPAIRTDVFTAILEVLFCLIILNCSGIDFQESTKIFFYGISLCAALKIEDKKEYVYLLVEKVYKKMALFATYLYAAFSLVGQRIFIYPLTLKVTADRFFVFAVTVAWFVPVVWSFLYWMDCFGRLAVRYDMNKKRSFKLIIVLMALLLLPAFYNLAANNPGISSRDTLACMGYNAHNLRGMMNWHPAFYCMVLSMILKIWDSTYAVIFVQYFFWLYVMLEFLLYLRKKGLKDGVILFIAFFAGINAANFMHLNTIWKDVPYALSFLWVLVILFRLSVDGDEYRRSWYIYAELVVALTGTFFYKKNGPAAVSVVVIFMVVMLRRNIKIWCTLLVTVLLILFIKYPLYSYFEVKDMGRYGMYIGLSQDILGAYYSGGQVSEETLKMINVMTDYNNAEYEYNPTWAGQSYDLDVEPVEFIANYIDTFLKNPVLILRAVIDREDAVWDIYPGQDTVLRGVDYHLANDEEQWKKYYPDRVYISLYDQMSEFTAFTARSQWISAIEWRSGLFMLLGLLSTVFVILRKGVKECLLIIAPVLGHILSLMLSTGWSDFRYFWPINLMNMCIIFGVLMIVNNPIRNGRESSNLIEE